MLLEGDFADYPVNGKLTTTAEVQDAADTLANLTVVDAIAPLSTGKTDQSGAVTFAPLETGAYLITGKPVVVGDKRYIPAPGSVISDRRIRQRYVSMEYLPEIYREVVLDFFHSQI